MKRRAYRKDYNPYGKRVQNLDEAVCFSFWVKFLQKDMNPSFLLPTQTK